MKTLFFLFLLVPNVIFAQNLSLLKATKQTINQGASSIASTNYVILINKTDSFFWSIDSVYSIADNKKVKYTIVKVDNPALTSPNYEKMETFEKKYKGGIQITFSSIKVLAGGGNPNAPRFEPEGSNDYSRGVKLFYTVKKSKMKLLCLERTIKTKTLKVTSFEILETVNAR